jgi:hypothetical protein
VKKKVTMPSTIKNFTEFISLFLEKRKLGTPDGRPLYEYKISNGRYDLLKILLKESWEENRTCYACFVLYAVEFLRAESTEGHLRWDYIFDSIGRASLNTHQSRTKIVEEGLNYWKREIFQGQHREFLETLRFESGLPNSSLYDNSNLSSLIKAIFQLVESFRLNEEEIIPLIEERIEKYPIPMVLRQGNFYGLVTKLCFKFLEFKERFDLSNQPNPTEYLQNQLVNWRTEMPLKIEGERMNEFFNSIISDIAKLKKIEPLALLFETILVENDGQFLVKTFLTIPKGVYTQEALGLEDEDFDNLSGYFSLNLEVENKVKYLTSFTKLNNGKISARGVNGIQIPVDLTDQEWTLFYASDNLEIRIETDLSKYFKISSIDPLVFVESNPGKWTYRGSAPLKIKDSECRLLLDDCLFSLKGSVPIVGKTIQGLSVYHIGADSLIHDIENQSEFWIKLAQEIESNKVLDFSQSNLPKSGSFDFLKENEYIYLGFPKVYLLNRILGLKEIFSGTIEILDQEKKWVVTNSKVFGRRKFRFKDRSGNILGVKIINVVPSDFEISVNLKSKTIDLSSSCDFKVFLSRNGIKAEPNTTGNSIEIFIDPTVDDVTSNSINLGVSFNSFGIIELKIPNPNFTEVFVNGDGKVVERASYSLSKIHGLRIINNNYSGVAEKKIYKLKLNDVHNRDASALEIRKEIWVEAFSRKTQALYHCSQQINQLFSLSTNTRAKVRVSSDRPHHFIEISKYDLETKVDYETGRLFCETEEADLDIKLSAFRLDRVFNTAELIGVQLKDNSCNINDILTNEGFWFVFSSSDSQKSVFPTVIIRGEKRTTIDEPIQFLWEGSFLSYDQRIFRFKEFFDTHYLNFSHPVWKELYELYKATEHLPISALDVWKGLVKSPKGMLTFLFSHYADSALIQKVSQELGFIWHLISVYRWQEAFGAWIHFILNSETFYQHSEILKSMKLSVIKNQLGLHSLVVLLSENVQAINITFLSYLVNSDINGEEGRLGIRTRHPEGVYWASYAGEFILEKLKQLPEELKNIIPIGLHSWQKPVVYLPVILGYQSINSRFIKVNELSPEILLGIKLNIDFDKTYFDDVYSKVQGYCFNQYFNNPKEA